MTVGYASGVIPRIPLNLVLLEGHADRSASSSSTSPPHRPTSSTATRRSCCELLAAGRVVPHIGARFPLDDAVAALRYVADGEAIGKVLLDIS